jgi:hypothetical protein
MGLMRNVRRKNKNRAAPAEKSAAMGDPLKTSTPYGSPAAITKESRAPNKTARSETPRRWFAELLMNFYL